MAYITYSDYVKYYGVPACEQAEFPMLAEQASDVIDAITGYRIEELGFSELPIRVRTLVSKATACEMMHIAEAGGFFGISSGSAGVGFTVGHVRVDKTASGHGTIAGGSEIASPMVYALLEQTGLLNRRVGLC